MPPTQIAELIGQILGVITIILGVLATQFPKRWQILLVFTALNFLTVFNQLLVGSGYASALGCAVATIHCPINAYKAKKELPTHLLENVLWSAVYFAAWGLGVYLTVRDGTASWLDVWTLLGTVTFLGSVFVKKERDVRLFTFANSLSYCIYNALNLNVAAVSQVLTMISVVIALIRYRETKNKES